MHVKKTSYSGPDLLQVVPHLSKLMCLLIYFISLFYLAMFIQLKLTGVFDCEQWRVGDIY